MTHELSILDVTQITLGLSLRYAEAQKQLKACVDLGVSGDELNYWAGQMETSATLLTAIRERGLSFIDPEGKHQTAQHERK
jgi:hypothetical protein